MKELDGKEALQITEDVEGVGKSLVAQKRIDVLEDPPVAVKVEVAAAITSDLGRGCAQVGQDRKPVAGPHFHRGFEQLEEEKLQLGCGILVFG